jgi:hypothetical protein
MAKSAAAAALALPAAAAAVAAATLTMKSRSDAARTGSGLIFRRQAARPLAGFSRRRRPQELPLR